MSCHGVRPFLERLVFTTLCGAAALTLSAARADADPPGRVARISFISGSASFRPASLDEWANATLNYPMTIGDHLWTDRGARAELDLGAIVVRVAPFTEFSILDLDDRSAQLRVTQGSVAVRVRDLGADDQLEVDTPNGAAELLRPGNYRVDVNENGDISTITVRHGEAEVTAGDAADASFPIHQEQATVLTGVELPRHDFRAAVPIDDFEDWSLARDRRAENAQSARYVSRDMIGYGDLDDYGAWRTVPEYGAVWVPRVQAEWVPYRNGHWAWIDPWGWTWIDDAPWGFAPFHYGRWVYMPAGGWGWVPGRVVARPVYAPALVAFVGVGGANWHASLSVGSAPVGWFPLGPREPFVPGYRVSPAYVRNVNITHVNVTNVTNVNVTNINYVNRDAPRAVTVVSRETFVQARPVAAAAVAVPREQVRVAAVVGTTAPVVPQRVSIVGQQQTTVRVAAPPPIVATRQVVVRHTPPPAPVPFVAKQAALQEHPGQPVDRETESALRARTMQSAPPPALVRPVAPSRTPTAASRQPTNVPANAPPKVPANATNPANPPNPATPVNRPPAAYARPSDANRATPAQMPPADIGARQSHERADFENRQAAERAQLRVKHQHDEQAIADAHQRAQVKQQHQRELNALQERQKQDHDALQKRQAAERKQQQPAPRRTPEKDRENDKKDKS
jgi:hypothetical protein